MCFLFVCYIWIHIVDLFIFQCLIRLSKFLLEAQEFKSPKGMLFAFSVSTNTMMIPVPGTWHVRRADRGLTGGPNPPLKNRKNIGFLRYISPESL